MAVARTGAGRVTLQSKIDLVRSIIDGYQLDVQFSAEHCAVIADLTDTEIRLIVRRENPTFPNDTRHLHVIAYDWLEPQQWSWRSAVQIAHARDPIEAAANRRRQKLMLALRHAVKADMEDFRSCAEPRHCGVCESTVDLTTDHVKPPFVAIARSFLERHPVIALRQVLGCCDLIESEDIEAEWISFHASRAVYQLLCRSCNSSKGAR